MRVTFPEFLCTIIFVSHVAVVADELAVLPAGLTAERDHASAGNQVLVLNSGAVLTGRLTPRPDGYDVELPVGRRFVPSEMVRFKASDLNDAYLRMRRSLPELTPNQHVELARWCEANNLLESARRELLDALYLDPHRGDAKRMLQTLLPKPGVADGTPVAGSSLAVAPATVGRPLIAETRSLGGFSKPTARTFVQNVQPLLSSKCATGGCHGSGERSFALTPLVNGSTSTPIIAERNLAAVLKQIDISHPESSPLLQAADGAHCGSRRLIFVGRTGATQIEILRSWVTAAANELMPTAERAVPVAALETLVSEFPDPSGNGATVASAGASIPAEVTDTSTPIRVEATFAELHEDPVHRRTTSRQQSDSRVMKEIRHLNRRDPFDPAIFNQRYHAAPEQPEASARNGVR